MNILILLEKEPTHGYHIHKELGITTSTIYRHLDELEQEGVVSSKELETENTRIQYSLTSKGIQLLRLLQE